MNVPQVTNAEFVSKVVKSGGKFLVGEWRGCQAQVVKYVDDKGQGRQFVKLDHVIEYGNPNGGLETCKLSERLPVEIDAVEKVPVDLYSKGQTVVARIQQASNAKGSNTAGCNFGEVFVLVD